MARQTLVVYRCRRCAAEVVIPEKTIPESLGKTPQGRSEWLKAQDKEVLHKCEESGRYAAQTVVGVPAVELPYFTIFGICDLVAVQGFYITAPNKEE